MRTHAPCCCCCCCCAILRVPFHRINNLRQHSGRECPSKPFAIGKRGGVMRSVGSLGKRSGGSASSSHRGPALPRRSLPSHPPLKRGGFRKAPSCRDQRQPGAAEEAASAERQAAGEGWPSRTGRVKGGSCLREPPAAPSGSLKPEVDIPRQPWDYRRRDPLNMLLALAFRVGISKTLFWSPLPVS